MLTPGQYTHHPRSPTSSLRCSEWWMRCPCPCGCRAHARERPPSWCGALADRGRAVAAPAPKVEVYPTRCGDVTQVVIPPTIYETVQALAYHHLGDLYTEDHRIKGERALKEPARKGIPGLWAWLACHSAVLAPLLRVSPPRWQTTPKD